MSIASVSVGAFHDIRSFEHSRSDIGADGTTSSASQSREARVGPNSGMKGAGSHIYRADHRGLADTCRLSVTSYQTYGYWT